MISIEVVFVARDTTAICKSSDEGRSACDLTFKDAPEAAEPQTTATAAAAGRPAGWVPVAANAAP